MSLHSWLTFLITTIVICGSPGPNMLHMMTSGARHGFRRTFFSMAGCFLAVASLIFMSVAGVGALLLASPLLFKLLRYAGAGYLIWIGISAWRAPVKPPLDAPHAADMTVAQPAQLFRKGFLVGISNPKALLFAGAFFPQFINADAPELLQLTILFVTFTLIEITCYMSYALGGARIAGLLSRAAFRRGFNRATGAMFGLFGVLMLARAA